MIEKRLWAVFDIFLSITASFIKIDFYYQSSNLMKRADRVIQFHGEYSEKNNQR